jgi:hypothetical protein
MWRITGCLWMMNCQGGKSSSQPASTFVLECTKIVGRKNKLSHNAQ